MDYKLAFHWLQKAADQGDGRADDLISTMYGNGWGVPADADSAAAWKRAALAAGYHPRPAPTNSSATNAPPSP